MKILNLYAWEDTDLQREYRICSDVFDEINFYFQDEFLVYVTSNSAEHINANNIKLNVLTINVDDSFVKQKLLDVGVRDDLIHITSFPLYWILKTHHHLTHYGNKYYLENKKKEYFRYPFLTFNNKVKYHRCYLIDKLCANNLLSEGIFSFHRPATDIGYEWECYDGHIQRVDGLIPNSYVFDNTFVESFLHIPTESDFHTIAISEKTSIPILNELPFLVVGARGFHSYLKELGFKLYDEIFDYSFDDEEDIHLRVEKLLKNVQFVVENKHRLDELYSIIKPKIEFNKKHALDLVSSVNCLPDMMKTHYYNLRNKTILYSTEVCLLDHFNFFEDVEKVDMSNIRTKIRKKYYNYWYEAFNYDKIIEDIHNYELEEIVIFGEQEWEIWATQSFINIVNERNIKVIYTTGSVLNEEYLNKVYLLGINNIKIEQWSTYYFKYATHKILCYVNTEEKHIENTRLKYPFVCLNNRGHKHRCKVIDYIAHYNLVDKGIVSWIDPLKEARDLKYFDGRQLLLADDMKTKQDSYVIPNEYYESLFDFVTEATSEVILISEKIIKPLIFKKPFVVMGARGTNRYLENLGFKLYDEIIDYTFDDIEDLDIRAKMYVENMKKVSQLTNLDDIYNQLLHKIEHNYNLCFELARDWSDAPPEVQAILPYVETNQVMEELECFGIYKQLLGENTRL